MFPFKTAVRLDYLLYTAWALSKPIVYAYDRILRRPQPKQSVRT